jgi:hypothetical protein
LERRYVYANLRFNSRRKPMAGDAATVPAHARPKGRSPAYPSINLETAIQKARQLDDKERNYATPVATVAAHFGYGSLNGAALGAIAALKKYGLIDDEGSGPQRKARLSQLAEVILKHPDEAVRKTAIAEAALRPPLHRELWDKYHELLPSDSNLRWELVHDRGFTETGVSEFIPVYRATVSFAQLASFQPGSSEATPPDEDDQFHTPENADDAERPGAQTERRGSQSGLAAATRSYSIPLIGGGVIAVEGAFPITADDWDQFMAVLTAMKPGLVRIDAPSTDDGR